MSTRSRGKPRASSSPSARGRRAREGPRRARASHRRRTTTCVRLGRILRRWAVSRRPQRQTRSRASMCPSPQPSAGRHASVGATEEMVSTTVHQFSKVMSSWRSVPELPRAVEGARLMGEQLPAMPLKNLCITNLSRYLAIRTPPPPRPRTRCPARCRSGRRRSPRWRCTERDGVHARPQRPAAWAYASAESGRSKRYTWEHSGMSRPRGRAASTAAASSPSRSATASARAQRRVVGEHGRRRLLDDAGERLGDPRERPRALDEDDRGGGAVALEQHAQRGEPLRVGADGDAVAELRRQRAVEAAAVGGESSRGASRHQCAARTTLQSAGAADRRRHEERLPPDAALELTAVVGAERAGEQVLEQRARPRLGEARVHLVDDEEAQLAVGSRRAGSPSRPARRCRRRPAAAARAASGAGAWRPAVERPSRSRPGSPPRAAAPRASPAPPARRRQHERLHGGLRPQRGEERRHVRGVFPDPVSASMIASAPSSRGVQLPELRSRRKPERRRPRREPPAAARRRAAPRSSAGARGARARRRERRADGDANQHG